MSCFPERWDRDGYIAILWGNIDKEAYDQFGRVDLTESSYYNQPYDYFSVRTPYKDTPLVNRESKVFQSH